MPSDFWHQLLLFAVSLFALLATFIGMLVQVIRPHLLWIVLAAWCLWAVNWRRAWPILAEGGWLPLVLIGVMAALVFSAIWPSTAVILGILVVPNFLWQLGATAIVIGGALFWGWLQVRFGWEPPEISVEPPTHGHGHGDHGHEHHDHAVVSHNGHTAH
jgi:hypothetical protein